MSNCKPCQTRVVQLNGSMIDGVLQTAVWNPVTEELTLTLSNGTVITETIPHPDDVVTTLSASIDTTDSQNPVVTLTYVNEDGSQVPVDVTIPIPADVVTTLAASIVTVDPQNPVITLTYTNEDGSQVPVDVTVPIPADVVTTLAGAVDVTDPQNPVVTLTYVNEDGSQVPFDLTIPIPADVVTSLASSIDVTNAQNPVITLTYVNEDGSQVPVDITVPIPVDVVTTLAASVDSITDPENPVITLTYTNEDGSQTPVDVTIPVPSDVVTTLGASIDAVTDPTTPVITLTYVNEDGSQVPINITIPTPNHFQVMACDENAGLIGQTGLTTQATAANVSYPPVTWSITNTQGDIENVSIDVNTGVITYDVPTTFDNQGNSSITVTGTDAFGQQVSTLVCIDSDDPVIIEPLACSSDLIADSPDLFATLNLFGLVTSDTVFTDLAKTNQATNGQEIQVLENSSPGGGDLTTWNTNGPDYLENVVLDNPVLRFNSAQNEGIGIVTGNATSPFQLIALVSTTGSPDGNATIISGVPGVILGANDLGSTSWQLSRDGSDDAFIFRADDNFVSYDFQTHFPGTLTGSEVSFGTWAELTDGDLHLIVVDYDGTQVNGYMDGTLRFTVTANVVGLTGNQFRFAVNRGGNAFIDMDMAELLITDGSMTDDQLTQAQAYFLCKYGLDSSLISDPGPFGIETDLYSKISQFEKHTFSIPVTVNLVSGGTSTGSEFVYDTLNDGYYLISDLPTPGLGILGSSSTDAIFANLTSLNVPTYTDDVAAGAGGLQPNDLYATPAGEVRIKL